MGKYGREAVKQVLEMLGGGTIEQLGEALFDIDAKKHGHAEATARSDRLSAYFKGMTKMPQKEQLEEFTRMLKEPGRQESVQDGSRVLPKTPQVKLDTTAHV